MFSLHHHYLGLINKQYVGLHILAFRMWLIFPCSTRNSILPVFLFTPAYHLDPASNTGYRARTDLQLFTSPLGLGLQVLCESGYLPFGVIHCYLSHVLSTEV